MNAERLFTWSNRWFSTSVAATAGLALVSAIVGFVILPYAAPGTELSGLWDAICSAAGVPRAPVQSKLIAPTFKTTNVVVSAQMLGPTDPRAIGRGATLAQQCAICHGSNRQGQIDTPNLDGQPGAMVYKQLRDFQTGARINTIMGPFAANLGERDMLDLAAYYSSLPRQRGLLPDPTVLTPSIVTLGAPMRNIPPCASCHGSNDVKLGSASLDGHSAVYLKAQLEAFATGARRNDISQQMRNIARQMTQIEMDDAARYFASRP